MECTYSCKLSSDLHTPTMASTHTCLPKEMSPKRLKVLIDLYITRDSEP